MAHIVHLRKTQKGLSPVYHPLFKSKQPETSLVKLVDDYLKDRTKENRDNVILKCLPLLRHTIGRFLFYWPITRSFVDDIVGEGAYELCRAVEDLEETHVDKLASYILSRVRVAIETYMNNMQAIAAPALKKNYKERKKKGKPVYIFPLTSNTANCVSFDFDAELFEAFEILEKVAMTPDEKAYVKALLNGGMKTEIGKKQLQIKFENFLRGLLDD